MNGILTQGRRKIATAIIVLLVLLLVVVPAALAFDGREGDVVIIKANETIDDDVYVGAGEFTLDGTIKGDLIVGGGTVTINGTVEGDLIAAGQSVIINGVVEDDARVAGYAIIINGNVGDEVIVMGFSLENGRESSIGDDLISLGYQALLSGDVAGDATVYGGAVQLSGSIAGDATIDVGDTEPGERMPPGFPFTPNMPPVPSLAGGLTIDDGATIGGDLDYTANAEAGIPSGAVAGEIGFTQFVPEVEPDVQVKAPSPAAIVGRRFIKQIRQLITLLLVGALMMWLVPQWTRKLSGIVQTKPWLSLGWGVVAIAAFAVLMLALVIATIILAIAFGIVTLGELSGRFIALGGLLLGSAGFSFSVTWAYVTRIVISLLLGQLLFRLFKSTAAEHRWWPMLVGVLIFVIITTVPILSILARTATVLLGLGAVWIWGRDWLQRRKTGTAEVASVESAA